MMRKKVLSYFGFVFLFIFYSCNHKQENARIINPLYFDLPGLIKNQIVLLDSGEFELKKELIVNSNVELKTFKKVDWAEELSVFKEIDINAPVFRETFDVKTVSIDSKKRIIYKPKEGKKKGITQLTVSYNSEDEPVLIMCNISTENLLYNSNRNLHLYLKKINGKLIIDQFSIINREKIIFSNTLQNQIRSKVISSF